MLSRVPCLLVTLLAVTAPTTLTAQAAGAAGSTWTVGETGNSAQYRVREQLAGVEFENDAVGVTRDIGGTIRFDADGRLVTAGSTITIGLASLTSDKDRRDGYVRRRTLQTDAHPNATLSVTGIEGLSAPLPEAGEASFALLGTLTIRDRNFPTRWKVTAQFADGHVTGAATTSFTFEEAGLQKPSVMSVLSVQDTITLEYDFHFIESQ